MKFYRFASKEQFQGFAGTDQTDFNLNGVIVHVMGYIPNPEAGPEEDPNLPGWHVNTTGPVPGWELFEVSPDQPVRIFA